MIKAAKHLVFMFIIMAFFTQSSAQEGDLVHYQKVWQFEHGQVIQLVEWHPELDVLAVATENYVILLDSQNGEEIHRIEISESIPVADISWNSEGSFFAAGDTDGHVSIYDNNWKRVAIIFAPNLTSLDWHPFKNELATVGDTETAVTAFEKRQIAVWSTEGELLSTMKGLHDVHSAEYSPDGQMLASVTWSVNGALWNAETYRAISPFSLGSVYRTLSHQNYTQSIAWSSDSERIIFLSNNNIEDIYIMWDISTEQIIAEVVAEECFFSSLSMTVQPEYLAGACGDSTIRIWNLELSQNILTISDHRDIVTSVAWSPDGQFLASASRDGTVRLWEIDRPTE